MRILAWQRHNTDTIRTHYEHKKDTLWTHNGQNKDTIWISERHNEDTITNVIPSKHTSVNVDATQTVELSAHNIYQNKSGTPLDSFIA